jgi:membrane-associated protein
MPDIVDFVLHSDRHLLEFVSTYGPWVYALLFAIVFAETGFVVTPFLPGDSLLFATGALCASGALNTPTALGLLAAAAFLGNAVNYAVGRVAGPRVFSATDQRGLTHRLLNRDHLRRAHAFFESYGGKAVILGRFVPIVRTFVPFVAGAAGMTSHAFVVFNAVGATAWVGLCVVAGFVFGNVPIVKQNFSLVTVGIVVVSLLPVAVESVRHARQRRRDPRARGGADGANTEASTSPWTGS